VTNTARVCACLCALSPDDCSGTGTWLKMLGFDTHQDDQPIGLHKKCCSGQV
jgi:hypothetical protein